MNAERGLQLDFTNDARVGVAESVNANTGDEVKIGAARFVIDEASLAAFDAEWAMPICGKQGGLGGHAFHYEGNSLPTQMLLLMAIDILTVWIYKASS